MESLKRNFALTLILAAASSSVMAAGPASCPAGDYGNLHMRYTGYNQTDGYVSFAAKEDHGSLKANTDYWLSNYAVDKDWARVAYTAGLTATTEGSKVWIHCDGKTATQIYVYSSD
jgi:hypothetical protein